MRSWIFVVFLLTIAHSAYIYGDIYASEDMQKLNHTVIKIKGESFSYYLVAEKSNYSLYLPDGRYDITAEHYRDGELLYSTSENLYLSGEDARLDLVLASPAENLLPYVVIAAILAAIIVFAMSRRISEAPVKKEPPRPKELDEDAKKVLEVIAGHEGRMTQKELKEVLNYSDSKISLILSELEHEGLVKRFKKGRGNIIRKMG